MNNRKITDWIEPDARNMDLAPTSSILYTNKQRMKKMLALEWEVVLAIEWEGNSSELGAGGDNHFYQSPLVSAEECVSVSKTPINRKVFAKNENTKNENAKNKNAKNENAKPKQIQKSVKKKTWVWLKNGLFGWRMRKSAKIDDNRMQPERVPPSTSTCSELKSKKRSYQDMGGNILLIKTGLESENEEWDRKRSKL